jgi:hypothetical protein
MIIPSFKKKIKRQNLLQMTDKHVGHNSGSSRTIIYLYISVIYIKYKLL